MHRKLMSVLVGAALFAFAPQNVFGQFLLGPEVAWNDDFDIGIGAGVEFDLDNLLEGLGLQGDFLYFFPGDVAGLESFDQDYMEFNANATYDFPLKNSTVVPYALAGANIGIASLDYTGSGEVSVSDGTEVGLNLGGGIQFDLGKFRPRVGARFVLGGWETFTIYGFLPFVIGG